MQVTCTFLQDPRSFPGMGQEPAEGLSAPPERTSQRAPHGSQQASFKGSCLLLRPGSWGAQAVLCRCELGRGETGEHPGSCDLWGSMQHVLHSWPSPTPNHAHPQGTLMELLNALQREARQPSSSGISSSDASWPPSWRLSAAICCG
jgi:hypothetical protein